jgi:hypothetical protein
VLGVELITPEVRARLKSDGREVNNRLADHIHYIADSNYSEGFETVGSFTGETNELTGMGLNSHIPCSLK